MMENTQAKKFLRSGSLLVVRNNIFDTVKCYSYNAQIAYVENGKFALSTQYMNWSATTTRHFSKLLSQAWHMLGISRENYAKISDAYYSCKEFQMLALGPRDPMRYFDYDAEKNAAMIRHLKWLGHDYRLIDGNLFAVITLAQ